MSNPSPPTFDRRARAQVSWTYDRDTGKVDLVATGDGLDARITAANFAYAASITKLLLDAPPARAFEPVEPPDESTLPPQALADADDNVGDLKAGEAQVGPYMSIGGGG
jgi:hypothetical protein